MFPAFNKVGIGLRPRVEMVSSMQCLSLWSLELSICHGYRGINRPFQLSMVSPEGRGSLVPLGVSEELEGSRRYVCRDGKEMRVSRGQGWKGSLYARQSSLDFIFLSPDQLCIMEVKLWVVIWGVHWRPARLDDKSLFQWFLQVVVQEWDQLQELRKWPGEGGMSVDWCEMLEIKGHVTEGLQMQAKEKHVSEDVLKAATVRLWWWWFKTGNLREDSVFSLMEKRQFGQISWFWGTSRISRGVGTHNLEAAREHEYSFVSVHFLFSERQVSLKKKKKFFFIIKCFFLVWHSCNDPMESKSEMNCSILLGNICLKKKKRCGSEGYKGRKVKDCSWQ